MNVELENVSWHILGVGAIGSLWACYLEKTGHGVELLFKDHAALDRFHAQGGLTLVAGEGNERFSPHAGVAGIPGTPVDSLLITTKAHQTLDALEACRPRISRQCHILLLQNGMGIAERIAERFPRHALFCAVTTDGAYCPQAFTVVHAGTGQTDIGAYRHQGDPREVIEHLPRACLDIRPCEDIEARQWQKLALNCAINGLTVVYHCRNGALLDLVPAKNRIASLCGEIQQVGIALGYSEWLEDLPQKTGSVLRATAANYNSMYQDIENRRCTEIDYLNGYLLQQAQGLGIECPENQKLYDEIKQMERDLNCR